MFGSCELQLVKRPPVLTAMQLEREGLWGQSAYPTVARPKSGTAAQTDRMDGQGRFKILGFL